MIEIKTHLSREVYIKEYMRLAYKHPFWIITTILGLVVIGLWLFFWITGSIIASKFGIFYLFFGIYFLIIQPIRLYFNAKKNYDNNSRISEPITYKIDEEWVEQIGESFTSKASWAKMYKTAESDSAFLIYSNKTQFYFLPKQDMTAEQITALQALLKTIPLQKK
jgi:YcxB-like protein